MSVAAAIGCGGAGIGDGEPITFDACAPLTVESDANLSDAQAAGIDAAIALWNQRAGTRLTRAAGPGPSGQEASGLPIHFQAAAPPFHGLYDAPNGQVFINTDLDGEALAITITHEIGHAYGLTHVSADQRTSVMNPNNLVVEPTPEDVDTLAMR